MIGRFIINISVLVFVFLPLSAVSLELSRAEKYCQLEGFAKANRQTIMFLDEHLIDVQNGDDITETNREIIRLVMNFVDPEKVRRNNIFSPRERFTIFVLPRDGTEPKLLFTGCQPFFSEEEVASIENGKSTMDRRIDIFFW